MADLSTSRPSMRDRVAVFNQGRLEQIGTGVELYHRSRTFVADFIGEANLLPAEFVARAGAGDTVRVRVKGGLGLLESAVQWPDGLPRGLISVRPKKVHVSKRLVNCENVFEARVETELFQGAIDRLSLAVDGGCASYGAGGQRKRVARGDPRRRPRVVRVAHRRLGSRAVKRIDHAFFFGLSAGVAGLTDGRMNLDCVFRLC